MIEETIKELVERNDKMTEEISAMRTQIAYLTKLLTAQGGERENDLLTLTQVAARLKVSKRTVRRYVEQGLLPKPQHSGKLARWYVRDVRTLSGLEQGV